MIELLKTIKIHRSYIIALTILFVFVSLSGTTYSLFLKNDTTDSFTYNTGLLDLQFVEDEQISLDSVFPIIDSKALEEEPYTLTIKNTGTLTYLFDLKMLSDTDENVINSKYIKVKVNDQLPTTLYAINNTIYSNVILYPGEEKTFKINIWLDIDTPNGELGKKFIAKVVTTGSSIYKTLDSSGANHPILKDNMIPIYYDESTKVWKKADNSNTVESYEWYNYNNQKWANVAVIKNTDKKIYDVTRKNNLTVKDIHVNSSNVVIDEKYLDLSYKHNYEEISNIIRLKINNITEDKIYIISNGKISYYYDVKTKKFVLTNGEQAISSKEYNLEEDNWYIIGYTYDGNEVNFYADGNKLTTGYLNGTINSNSTFKLGTNNKFDKISNIIVGDIYIYNDILTAVEINHNYKKSINIIYDNLVCGYNEFTPMTLEEYYLSKPIGTTIKNEDISMYYVWIPRYKYRLWNVTGENNIDSYDAYKKGIEIQFEKDNTTSGVINCKNNECYTDELLITKVTNNDNGKYYTHPAFKDLSGIWVSKYEISTSNSSCNKEDSSNCLSTNFNVESKPENYAWRNNYLSNFYKVVKKISNNHYIINNSEWGAISYLTHSKYGLCENGKCNEIGNNNTFISGNDISDSTTGNMSGVFDMSGSASEFVMSNYANENQEVSLENTHFGNTTLKDNEYTLYYKDTFVLGDATKEISLKDSIWYNNQANYINDTNNWFIRGGVLDMENSGIFSYNATTDINNEYISTRIIIK